MDVLSKQLTFSRAFDIFAAIVPHTFCNLKKYKNFHPKKVKKALHK